MEFWFGSVSGYVFVSGYIFLVISKRVGCIERVFVFSGVICLVRLFFLNVI